METPAAQQQESPTQNQAQDTKPVQPVDHQFGIGRAIKELRNGSAVRRAGWNGKNMSLELQIPDAHSKMTLPYVFIHTAQGDLVPWLCSQTDLLATDWELV